MGVHGLDPRRGAGGQEANHLRPVIGRPVGQAEAITVGTVRSPARELAQFGWRSRKSLADLAVQPAQAAEAGGKRDLARSAAAFRRSVSWRNAPAGSARRRAASRQDAERTAGAGAAPSRRGDRPAPRRSSRSSAPSLMRRSPRDTTLDVPDHAGVAGDASGRQRRQGRNPSACAAAAVA